METVYIQLLDNTLEGDKIYQYKDIKLVNIQRESQRLRQYCDYALYILLGPDIKYREIYIGQSTDIGRRLYEHKLQKPFWTECIFFINETHPFTKTDIAWLEEHVIKDLLDLNYFQAMHNYQIPQNVQINSIIEPYLNETCEQMKLLIRIFGGLKIDLNSEKRHFTEGDKTAKHMIDRIAKSYIEHNDESMYGCSDIYDDYDMENSKYMEMDNGKVLIFKGCVIKGKIPKKYKDKVVDGISVEDMVVDNMIKAKEIMGNDRY